MNHIELKTKCNDMIARHRVHQRSVYILRANGLACNGPNVFVVASFLRDLDALSVDASLEQACLLDRYREWLARDLVGESPLHKALDQILRSEVRRRWDRVRTSPPDRLERVCKADRPTARRLWACAAITRAAVDEAPDGSMRALLCEARRHGGSIQQLAACSRLTRRVVVRILAEKDER